MTDQTETTESQIAPWSDYESPFDQLRARIFDAFGLRPSGVPAVPRDGWGFDTFRAPRIDVSDTGTSFRIVAEIPGIPKEKLDIRVKGTHVELRGEQVKESEEKQTEFVHRERSYAGFYRSLELPEPVVAAKASAKVVDGVLELELPKEHPSPSPAEVKVPVQ
jgi:HSP20 family protein